MRIPESLADIIRRLMTRPLTRRERRAARVNPWASGGRITEPCVPVAKIGTPGNRECRESRANVARQGGSVKTSLPFHGREAATRRA